MLSKYRIYLLLVFSCTGYWLQAQTWLWANDGAGIGSNASKAITSDDQGNVYATGNIAGMATFNGTVYQGKGVFDVFIAKYDVAGSLVWLKLAGGAKNDLGNAIKYRNGFLYISGGFEDSAFFESTVLKSKGNGDAFVAKYDLNGDLVWAKGAGGANADYATCLDVDNAGNVYIGGVYENAITFDTTRVSTTNLYGESFYAKYDANGNVQWARTTGGNNASHITGLAYDNNHSIFITGFFGGTFKMDNNTLNSQSPSYDIFMAKVDDNATVQWLKKAGSGYEDEANAVCSDAAGNMIVTGYFAGTASFDSNQVTYNNYNDVFVAKYDPNGNNLWVKAGKGPQFDVGFAVATDAQNNIYATGIFETAISFEGHNLTCPHRQFFDVSYDANGNFRWTHAVGGTQNACGLGIVATTNNNIAVSGYYGYSCIFDNIALTIADASNIFIARYQQPDVNGIEEVDNDAGFTLYPNPASTNQAVSFTINEGYCNATISIHNALGQMLQQQAVEGNRQLMLYGYAPGIYSVTLQYAQKRVVKKVVVF